MKHGLIRWLLDLDVIPPDARGVRLVWEHAWPGWVWVVLLLGAALLSAWSYTRLLGPARGRAVLAVTRALLVVLIFLIISGPMLQQPRETVEQDWVLVLVDRSASMNISDVQAPPSSAQSGRLSRDDQLRSLLHEHAQMWQQLAEARHVVWLGFHDATFNLPKVSPASRAAGFVAPVDLGEPSGRRTRLNAALEQALQRAAARAVSGIVLFSDGRTTDPPTRAIISRLRSDKISVFAVGLGSSEPFGDLAIRSVEAPQRAFIRDEVPVVVELDQLGSAVGGAPAVVRLIDETTGQELDRVQLPDWGDSIDHAVKVTMTARPLLAGEATWKVVVQSDQPDLVSENNVRTFRIELIDRPLRVLYVDGYPRWEYRYLKNLLIREKSIESSVMLISADREFAQEGNQPISRLPRSPEEFAPFDVILLGDVPASFFSPEQLDMIQDHVAQRGAGLLWIGGERYTPSTYAGTVLADLLPMRGSLALRAIGSPVNMVSTALADRLGLLRLASDDHAGWPRELAEASFGWSRLHYAQRIEPGRLKPTAEVLAETAAEFRGARLPLVIHLRYGAGQIVYVATDETWRWRYGRGELLPERFWVQIIRMLGRESVAGLGDSATLDVNPRRLTTSQVMRINLELLDSRLVQESRLSIAAMVETSDGTAIAEIELHRLDRSSRLDRDRVANYAATFVPGVSGQLRVRINDPTLADLKLEVPIEVYAPDDELRRPETDHALLEVLAAQTGGRMLAPDELDQLPSLLPNRSVRTINPITERIWDSPLAFGLLLLLAAGEWIGRKLIRLA